VAGRHLGDVRTPTDQCHRAGLGKPPRVNARGSRNRAGITGHAPLTAVSHVGRLGHRGANPSGVPRDEGGILPGPDGSGDLSDRPLAAPSEDDPERGSGQAPVPDDAANRPEQHRHLGRRGEHRQHTVVGIDL